MPHGLLHSLLFHFWSIFLIVFFFGSSIFVHELGHFLAARRRGLIVQRFSIGFGPPIWSWHGRDGVEYCIAWLPIGGYVLMPQFADLGLIEGEGAADAAKLPPIDYASKMIVSVSGALFNVIFAFALACIIWMVGQPVPNELTAAARIGYIRPTLELADGSTVTSPAAESGLRVGDRVLAIDGEPVANWSELNERIFSGAGRDAQGRPQALFTLERDGRRFELTLHPRISTEEKIRQVGISPWSDLIVDPSSPPDSIGARIGFRPGDQILDFDGQLVGNISLYQDYLSANRARTVVARAKRGDRIVEIAIPPRPGTEASARLLGLTFAPSLTVIHPSPFAQVGDQVMTTFRSLSSLLNPHTDVGLSKLTGPIGIVHYFSNAADEGVLVVINFTIMINVALAFFNLLPIPVLDGGHMLFATIGRLRGRALPINFIVNTQVVFSILLISMVLYISVFDVRRWQSDARAEHASATAIEKP